MQSLSFLVSEALLAEALHSLWPSLRPERRVFDEAHLLAVPVQAHCAHVAVPSVMRPQFNGKLSQGRERKKMKKEQAHTPAWLCIKDNPLSLKPSEAIGTNNPACPMQVEENGNDPKLWAGKERGICKERQIHREREKPDCLFTIFFATPIVPSLCFQLNKCLSINKIDESGQCFSHSREMPIVWKRASS